MAKILARPKTKLSGVMPCFGEYLPGAGCDQCRYRWPCLRTSCALDREVQRHTYKRLARHDPAYEPEEVA